MTTICPLCLEIRALDESCSCDVDGIPPSAWCPWPRPVSPGSATRRPSIGRHVLVHPDALAGAAPASGVCSCGRPTRDHAFLCASCAIRLGALLDELPQTMVDLDARLTASVRGIDYQAWAEPRGAGEDFRPGALPEPTRAWLRANEAQGTANPTPLPVLMAAVEARAALISGVRWLVAMSLQARLTPDPRRPVVDVASWLRARVDAMTLHPAFAFAPGNLEHLVGKALRSVAPFVATEQRWADPGVRDQLMQSALTASEIAAVAITVGEVDGTRARDKTAVREWIRTRVNDWHRRGRIEPVSYADNGRPRFRFGEVHLLLLQAPARKPAEKPTPTPARPGLDGLADWPNHPTTEETR